MRVKVVESAPGKVMFAGEWSVLELGNPCIVVATNKGVSVCITESDSIIIDASDVGLKNIVVIFQGKVLSVLSLLTSDKKRVFGFAKKAVEVVLCYLQEINREYCSFHLSIQSEISSLHKKEKLGFGSSAATVVAIVKGLLKFHNFDIASNSGKEIIFKLSCIAHYLAQGNLGSGFDVAASTYGGVLVYRRFDSEWLDEKLASTICLRDIVAQPWPCLEVVPVQFPESICLNVGFVGYGVVTKKIVAKMECFKKDHKNIYIMFCDAIAMVVSRLLQSIKQGNKHQIIELIKQNRILLQKLSDASGIALETKELKTLCDIAENCGGSAKFSGAGGGDCGISICFDEKTKQAIIDGWKENGIELVTSLRFYPSDVFKIEYPRDSKVQATAF